MRSILLSLLVVTVAACGGKSPSSSAPHGGAHGDEHAGEHPPLPPALEAFHDVLAPLWHAEGDDRIYAVCDNIDALLAAADQLGAQPAPEGVAAEVDWMGAADGLHNTVIDLRLACEGGDDQEQTTAFTSVHDQFHALMDLLPRS